jgi:hypothetical protein
METRSAFRCNALLLAAIGAGLLLIGGYVAAEPVVSTVQTWPARSGPALSSDDVLKVREIGGVSIQPGGDLVSFTTMAADPVCNCYHVKLNVLDLRTRRVRIVSDPGQPFAAPTPDGSILGWPEVAESLWSSDGRFLAYIVNRGGHGLLFVYDSRAKESRNLVLGGDEAFGFTWAKSGERIIYQTGGPRRASVRRLKQGERDGYLFGSEFAADPGDMPVIPRVPEPRTWQIDDVMFASDRAWSALRVIDVLTGERREATAKERAFIGTSEFSYSEGFHQDPTEVQSSDGRFTIKLGEPDRESLGRSITITRTDDPTVIRKTSADVCPGRSVTRAVAHAYWDAASERFVLICSQGDRWQAGARGQFAYLNPLNGSSRAMLVMEAMNVEEDIGRQCDMEAGRMVCVRESASEPPTLVALDLDRGTAVTLDDPNAELRGEEYPRVDRLVWSNSKGLSTQADLVYPYDYVSNTRYPLVITQYRDGGFLRGNVGNENPIFAYAKAGLLVLNFSQTPPAPEKPGLSLLQRARLLSSGNEWRKSIQNSLDIAIQDLIDRGLVDPSRVAYTGLSGGANQIDYALAQGRHIAVAITSTCCLGPYSWSDNPFNPDFYRVIDVEDPAIDSNLSKWSLISPELHVKDIHAAILANVAEHERFAFRPLWALMRYAHKPMEAYIYADEYHVKFQPTHLSAIQHRNIDWLRFWLQGYQDPDPAKVGRYARWRRLRKDWCRHDSDCVRPPVGTASNHVARLNSTLFKRLLTARPTV